MPRVQMHAPGTFSWVELRTPDQSAAKQFYGALLGWDAQDTPMDPGSVYTMFKLDGRDVAGCFPLGPRTGTMPPHWGLFVTVESADATASRAAALGGRVLQPVIDVFGIGYAAVIQDPTGAAIGLWEPGTHIGTGIAGENGTLCWADLNTLERQRARAFYEELFGWSFVTGKNKDSDGYLHIMNGKRGIGGILPESYRNKNAPPHWLPYFLAADCEASTTKAQELGGRVYVPPTTIENSLRFSVIADPQGAVFALFMPLH